jgi:hypothetical protein
MVERLPKGTRVEVRNGFDRSWSGGFEVAGHEGEDRYVLLRSSDGAAMPGSFPADQVRRTRKGSSMWWV